MSKARELWEQRQKKMQDQFASKGLSDVSAEPTITVNPGSRGRELWAQRQQEMAGKQNRFQSIFDRYNQLISTAGGMDDYYKIYRRKEERDSYRSDYYQDLEQLRQEIRSQMDWQDGIPGDLGSNLLSGLDSISKALSSYEDYYGQREAVLAYDVDAGRRELDELDSQIDALKQQLRFAQSQKHPDLALSVQAQNDLRQQEIALLALQQLRSQKTVEHNQISRTQKNYLLEAAADPYSDSYDKAFDSLSQYQSGNNDLTYEYINGRDNGRREEILSQSVQSTVVGGVPFAMNVSKSDTFAVYDRMTDQEIGIYNYYYAKDGKEKAEEYLDSIRQSLSYRTAQEMYSKMENDLAMELLFQAAAGVNQFETGLENLLRQDTDYVSPSWQQQLSGMVREDLADVGPRLPEWIGGQSLGQAAGDLISTTFNMAPSMLASSVANMVVPGSGAVVGNALMGASAAGSAYQEAINRGYDQTQARGYAALVGGSEAAMQYVLGGIGKLGGTGKYFDRMLEGVDSALWRIGGKWAAGMASEGIEEGLQEVLTPVFENLIFRTNENVDWGEVAYSALLGAISSGVLEGSSVIAEDVQVSQTGRQLREAGVDLNRLAQLGQLQSADSVAYQLAGKINENTGAYTIGRMFYDLGAQITEQNQADIAKSLVRKGFTQRQAQTTAEAFARVVMGDNTFSEAQLAIIEANELLSKTVADVIINPNSTVNQRTRGYNEMLMQLAEASMDPALKPELVPEAVDGEASAQAAVSNPQPPKAAAPLQGEPKVPSQQADSSPDQGSLTIAEVKDGRVAVQLADGSTADAAQTELGEMEPVYEAIARMDVSANDANVLLRSYDGNGLLSPAEYGQRIGYVYRLGKMGVDPRQAQLAELSQGLTDGQLDQAYRMGREAGRREDARQQARSRPQRQKPREYNGYLEIEDAAWAGRTEVQEELYAITGHVAETLEIKVHIFKPQDSADPRGRFNGWYRDGEIWLNADAGLDANSTMLFTLAHELTHHIRQTNPEGFRKLSDFLMEQYFSRGVSAPELIENKLSDLRRLDENKNLSEEKLYDLAWEEVVASSMEPMLQDGEVLQKLRGREPGLWEAVKDQVMAWAEKLRKAAAKFRPKSPEGRAVLQMKDSMDRIEGLFLEALEGTREAVSQEEVSEGTKNSAREGGGMAASVRYSQAEEKPYSYAALTAKPDMQVTAVRSSAGANRADVVHAAKQNAAKIGKFNAKDGSVSVRVKDIDRDVVLSTGGLRHSLDRRLEVNGPVVEQAGQILANSIRINEMTPENPNARESYILLGAARNGRGDFFVVRSVVNQFSSDLISMDVLYAINAKAEAKNPQKKNRLGDYPQGFADEASDSLSGSKVSIAELLDYVNRYFPDILPEDVLQHYGHENRPAGDLGRSVRYQERNEDLNRVNGMIRQENGAMREDLERWREALAILDIREGGAIFTQGSVDRVAKSLIRIAQAKGSSAEFRGILMDAYNTLADRKAVNWSDVVREFQPVIDWLMEHREIKLDLRAQEALSEIRKTRIYLDPKQKEEAKFRWGSMRDFMRAHMGRVTIASQNSISLDEAWQQWAYDYPDIFDKNMNSLDMVQGLSEALERLKGMTTDVTFGIDRIHWEQSFLQEAYDGMFQAAVYPVENGKLLPLEDQRRLRQQGEHEKEIRRLTAQNEKKLQSLMQQHQKQMQAVRNMHQAEIRGLQQNYQRKQEWRAAGREKTELRHKIQRTVKQLNSMLIRETKNRHIPEVLKKAVLDALDAVNMDTVSAEARLQQLNAQLASTTDPAARAEIIERINTVTEIGGHVREQLLSLEAAYGEIRRGMDPTLSYAFDEEIGNQIQQVRNLVGKTALRDMSRAQLEAVDELYTAVMTRVRNMNEAFATVRQENIDALGKNVIRQVVAAGGQKDKRLSGTRNLRAFFWNNEKPVYAFERIGSSTLSTLYENVRKGEDVWASDIQEAKAFADATGKRYGQKQWDVQKTWEFKDRLGNPFQLNLGQVMTLYAYSKRKQAWDHLQKGGFQFDPGTKLVEKKGKVFEVSYDWTSAQTYKVDAALLGEIIGKLTPEQKAYADRMQAYLSDTMGAKGNEVSMKLYGIRLFKERYYFPLRSSQAFLEQEANKANGEVKIKNKGFTKQTQPKANNPVFLREFGDVWADHVNEMSLYHGFTLPLEDFYRVRNYQEGIDETMKSRSVNSAIQGAHGKEATAYIEQLLKDLNAGAIGDSRAAIGKGLVGLHKKDAVMASLSVVVQQPTALYRAMSMVDPKYFGADGLLVPAVYRTFRGKRHNGLWEELKTYAPVAIIKEIGYFDTGVGRTARDWLQQQEYEGWKEKAKAFISLKDGSYRDEVFSKLPALADELAWVSIWEAVKKETDARNPGLMGRNREDFLRVAGERFTEVITRTQVYDSVLSRSSNMRSKDSYMNMATSFMAEPTTTANMVEDAIRRWRKGDKKQAVRVLGAVLGSNLINAALVSIVYAMRDDDEEQTFTEKYLSNFVSKSIDSMNPLTYLPFVRDIWSIMQGYDVERADMTLFTDLVKAVQKLERQLDINTDKLDEGELDAYWGQLLEAQLGVVDVIGLLFDFPVKNLRRDIVAPIFRMLTRGKNDSKTTQASLTDAVLESVSDSLPGDLFDRGSRGDKLYRAIVKGDEEYIRRLKAGYSSDSAYQTALRKALRENDPRIHEAAVARNEGNIAKYRAIVEKIKKEKRFSQDDIVAAVNGEINALSKGESSPAASKAKSLYDADDFRAVLESGDAATARAIQEDMEHIAQVNGKTAEEARKTFQDTAKDAAREGLETGKLSAEKAAKALVDWVGRSEEEARAEVSYWQFRQKYPDTYANSQWFDEYYREVEGSGIDIGTFMAYKDQVRQIIGEGKKERRMAVIDTLPITDAQKDALYLAEGWTESRLYEAPWH